MLSKLIIALYILATSSALILVKLGSKDGAPIAFVSDKIALNLNPIVLIGGLLYGISFLLYMFLISRYDLGYIIPLTAGFLYITIFFASFMIFKETFTTLKILGIALILGGVVLLNVK